MLTRLRLTIGVVALVGCHQREGAVAESPSPRSAPIDTVVASARDRVVLDAAAAFDAGPLRDPRSGERVLFDFRAGLVPQPLPATMGGRGMTHALRQDAKCTAKVMGTAEGAFTLPGTHQTLLSVGFECKSPKPDSWLPVWSTNGRLVVLDSDGNVVTERDVPGYTVYGRLAEDPTDVDSVIIGANVSDDDGTRESAFIAKLTPSSVVVTPLGEVWTEKNRTITAAVAYTTGRGEDRHLRLEHHRAPQGAPGMADVGTPAPLEPVDWRTARESDRSTVGLDDSLPWTLVEDFRVFKALDDEKVSAETRGRVLQALGPHDRASVSGLQLFRGPSGAFTAPGVHEDLFILAGQADDQPRGVIRSWIILGQGAGLSRPMTAPGFILRKVGDIDGDGVDEIVISDSGGTHQGYTSTTESLLELRGGHPVVGRLGGTDDACATGIPVRSETRSYVVFTARSSDGARRFRRRSYRGWCYRAPAAGPFVLLPEK